MTRFFDQQKFFYDLFDLIQIKDKISKNLISQGEGESRILLTTHDIVNDFLTSEFWINSEPKIGMDIVSSHFIEEQIKNIIDYYIYDHGLNIRQFVNIYGYDLISKIVKPQKYLFITRVGNFPLNSIYECKSLKIIPNTDENIDSIIKENSIPYDKSEWLKNKLASNKETYETIITVNCDAIEAVGFIKFNEEGRRNGVIFHDHMNIYDYIFVLDYATTLLKKFKYICNFLEEMPIFFEGLNFSASPSHFIMEIPSPLFISHSRETPGLRMKFDLYRHYKNHYKDECTAIETLIKNGEKRTAFENKKLQAIYWFGEALDENEFHHVLLKNVIALESLLLNEVNQGNGGHIARIAQYLIVQDRKTRKKISKLIEQAYEIRNDIVHNGKITIDNPLIIYELKKYSRYLISFILTNSSINTYNDITLLVQKNKNPNNP